MFVREHALAVAQIHRVTVIFVKGMQLGLAAIPAPAGVPDGPLTSYTVTYPSGRIPKTTWRQRIQAVYQLVEGLISAGDSPDILHAHIYNTADLAYLLQRRYSIPAVLTEQSSALPRKLVSWRQRQVMRFCENRLALILPVSKSLASFLPEYGIHTPLEVIPNTVNTEIFYPRPDAPALPDGTKQILVVAGLVPVKGIDYLLQALRLVKEHGGEFMLNIAGEGPERAALAGMAYELGISDQVRFLGVQTKPQVAEWMRQADFFALTSRWDNNPVVVMEAMASGLPVLASRVGGIPEMVTEKQGVLTEVGNVADIAQKLASMLAHCQEYSRQDICAYARVKYSYATIAEAFSAAYERASRLYRKR